MWRKTGTTLLPFRHLCLRSFPFLTTSTTRPRPSDLGASGLPCRALRVARVLSACSFSQLAS